MFTVESKCKDSALNYLNHNPKDFPATIVYFNLGDTVYPSLSNETIPEKSFGLNALLRNIYKLELKSQYDLQVTNAVRIVDLDELNINVSIYTTSPGEKPLIAMSETDIMKIFMKELQSYYFCNKQCLVLLLKNQTYFKLQINLNLPSEVFGVIKTTTKINFFSTDLNLTLITKEKFSTKFFSPEFSFTDIGIGGLDNQLCEIFRRAMTTRAFPTDVIRKLGIKHVKGLLLYGPPGTGKTLIARNIGKLLSEVEPKVVSGPEILNKYVGESERGIRDLFADAEKQYLQDGDESPLHIIIFDEIDAVCKARNGQSQAGTGDSIVNQLLSKMDGVKSLNNIFVIGMTNRKDLLDPALLRAGRMEIHIEVTLPTIEGRKQIFNVHMHSMSDNNMMSDDIDFDYLAENTVNFSGAEIEALVKGACNYALNDSITKKDPDIVVNFEHFKMALKDIVPYFGSDRLSIDLGNHLEIYNSINEKIKTHDSNLMTLLVRGRIKNNKTSSVIKVAQDLKIPYTKIIRPISLVGLPEHLKVSKITETFSNAYRCDFAVVVLDELETLVEFSALGVRYSNPILQTINTYLNNKPDSKIIILCTSDDDFFVDQSGLIRKFDFVINV